MSYNPPPPPPGQGGSDQNPYQTPGYASNPYQAPKKDNTLWWILGGIAAVILVCCCGAVIFFGWAGFQASEEVSSSAIDNGSGNASSATPVSEGDQVTVGGAEVLSGWHLNSSDDMQSLTVRNDSGQMESFFLTFYFMQDGEVVADTTCSTGSLDAGETDYSPTCVDAIDIGSYDGIRVGEGV